MAGAVDRICKLLSTESTRVANIIAKSLACISALFRISSEAISETVVAADWEYWYEAANNTAARKPMIASGKMLLL
jgi:hypothetical protein